jgi:hypothetical protein
MYKNVVIFQDHCVNLEMKIVHIATQLIADYYLCIQMISKEK